MASDDKSKAVAKQEGTPTSIQLTPSTSIDLSWLSEEDRKALLYEHTRGMLDISKKAQELHVDIGALSNALDELADTTKEVADSGNAVTASYAQTSNIGRVEVKMGNTEEAKSGKLSATQRGDRDLTPIYVVGGLIAIVLIAFALGG